MSQYLIGTEEESALVYSNHLRSQNRSERRVRRVSKRFCGSHYNFLDHHHPSWRQENNVKIPQPREDVPNSASHIFPANVSCFCPEKMCNERKPCPREIRVTSLTNAENDIRCRQNGQKGNSSIKAGTGAFWISWDLHSTSTWTVNRI